MTWAAAAPTYAAPAPTYVADEQPVVRYAGFWRRFWGLYVDQLLVNFAVGIANTLIGFAAGALISATATCDTYRLGNSLYRRCSSSEGVAITFLVIQVIVALFIWYRLIPRRLAAEGATPGMSQMGLHAETARDGTVLGLGAAFARSILPLLLQLGGLAVVASVFIFSFDPDQPVQGYWWWVGLGIGLFVACYGAALLTVVDRRHQTLYDKIVGSVVIEARDVNWWAVASLGCAATGVLAPLAIVFGHIGLHQLGDPRNRQAGHGIAVWGTVLGYVVTILGAVALAIVFAAGSPT